MDRALTSFICVWITLILVVNLFGIVGLFIGADSTWQALQEVKEIYSPFNVMNWLLVLLILFRHWSLTCGENGVENPYKLADLRLRAVPFHVISANASIPCTMDS